MFRAAALVGVGLLLGCESAPMHSTLPTPSTSIQPAGSTSGYALHVKGMGCPLCATNVKKAIERTPGVESVNIDLGAGIVKVSAKADRSPTEPQLRQAVANAGFQLDKIERTQ